MRILLVTIFATLTAQAQHVSGVVVDAENEPIPYVNLWNLDGSAGATTDEDGCFTIQFAEEGEELVSWASGYVQHFEDITDSDTIVVQKIEREIQQDELIVYPEKTLQLTLGDAHFENFYFNPGNVPWIFARYFPNEKEIQRVQYIDKAIVY